MKRILQNIRSRPPEFRLIVAVVLALIVTILIGIGWGMTFSRRVKNNSEKVPSPLNALGGSIKNVIQNSKTDQKDVQIIDNSTAGPTYQSAEDGDVIETETN